MRTLPHQVLLPVEPSGDADLWLDRLSAAFADTGCDRGFLAIAEAAVDACPGDPNVLILAAMAAILDERPERALVFLKRISKRYIATPTERLLQALALFQDGKRVAARTLLERHELTDWPALSRCFQAAGAGRDGW